MGQLFRLDLWPGVTIYPHDVVTGVLLLFFWFKNGVKVSDWKKEPIFMGSALWPSGFGLFRP
ncbi:hypothetical protein HY030_02655 [Candidatus Gottesmanbacteria bacterium]|nr:hypothetical protein [Candidatus Gottesmanbacteria bacterium]